MSGISGFGYHYVSSTLGIQGVVSVGRTDSISEGPKGAGFITETGAAYYWEALVQLAYGDQDSAKRAIECVEKQTYSCPQEELPGLQRLFGDEIPQEMNSPEGADQWLSQWMEGDHIWSTLSEPRDLYTLAFLIRAWDNPNYLGVLGVGETVGFHVHKHYLTKEDAATYRERYRRLEVLNSMLEQCPKPSNLRDNYSLSALQFLVEGEMKQIEYLRWKYPFEQMQGIHLEIQDLFLTFYSLDTDLDLECYLDRLSLIPEVLEGALERFESAFKQGICPPQIVLLKVLKQLQDLLPEDPLEHILVENLRVHHVEDEFCGRAAQIIESDVYPILGKCKEVLSQALIDAPEQTLTAESLEGQSYYEQCLLHHTSLPVIPSEITALGLQEVARIKEAMLVRLSDLGYVEGTLAQRLNAFAASDDNYYENTEAGREECLKDYASIMDRARKDLWPCFGKTPQAYVEMCRVPESMEQGKPGAYYWFPSIDGTRPGRFFVNLRDMSEQPKFGMETLAVHEAEPGHHFQLSIQAESDLPLVLKGFEECFNAYVEGWALYTERLALERGFFSSIGSELGHLGDEMLRAVRLVVDTKLHMGTYSREEAIAYMIEHTGMSQNEVETEIDRYLVLPGQACSYKLGQLKILQMREAFFSKHGNTDQSLRDFHDLLLGLGAVPMMTVEAAVADAIGG